MTEGPKWSRASRRNIFAVLRAVEAAVPRDADIDCRGAGRVVIAALADATGLPVETVCRSLSFLRVWRVLWLRFRNKGRKADVKFQRQVVVGLLAAERACPREVPLLMLAHRARRERIAPRRRPIAPESGVLGLVRVSL